MANRVTGKIQDFAEKVVDKAVGSADNVKKRMENIVENTKGDMNRGDK